MKILPVGKQSIQDILFNNLLYVDKTRQIYELLNEGNLYFLSRPRRFGKSLTISTLEKIFDGNKDLFKGLYIAEKTNYDWQKYPVLRFSFSSYGYQIENLAELLDNNLSKHAKKFEVQISGITLSERFAGWIEAIYKKAGKQVVILIDEYDKPIVDFINEIEKPKEI